MKNELYHSDTYLGEDYSDGLKHYKYISKEKVNGEWRYYYYHKTGRDTAAIYRKVQGDPNSKYGVYSHGGGARMGGRIDHVTKSDKLFSKTTSVYNKNIGSTFTLREVGKIEQGADAAKKALSKIGNQTLSSAKSVISKGKAFISKLFSNIITTKKTSTTHTGTIRFSSGKYGNKK